MSSPPGSDNDSQGIDYDLGWEERLDQWCVHAVQRISSSHFGLEVEKFACSVRERERLAHLKKAQHNTLRSHE
eukprot:4933906-Amphidinium_carterae.3